ncbi:MAG: hypothetical protein H7Y20_04395 [Bryobacteraceae bacterium]|nr:hypothetical protein [Bryobacteraceae bacterium]
MPELFSHPHQASSRVAVYKGAGPFRPESEDAETVALPATLLSSVRGTGWNPRFAIVVFTGPKAGCLTAGERDRVWRMWGVPILEHRLDESGRVIAEECDAHAGLHLRPGVKWDGEVITERCPCGLDQPRIVPPGEGTDVLLPAAA